jgi:molybdate transport system ATP-binding protein
MLQVDVHKSLATFGLHVRFAAPTPGVVALFGRSGCGKTTTINIIAGLLRPDAGSVELDGELLQDSDSARWLPPERRHTGYVFQDARLFPHLSVLGNLQYGARRSGRPSAAGDFDRVVTLLGLQALLQRRPHKLSGGERQRVALGRALLARPRLLLLDEPLASLDAARRDEVLPYLIGLRDEFALPMVYVSHNFTEVLQLATHVVMLDAGQVVAQGSLNEISLDRSARRLVGPEFVGTIVEGTVSSADAGAGIAQLQVGGGSLTISRRGAVVGERLRVQLLAGDIILATEEPRGLSVRNSLRGVVAAIDAEEHDVTTIHVDVQGLIVLAQITREAQLVLRLMPGMQVWVLVKALSTRGHAFRAPGV